MDANSAVPVRVREYSYMAYPNEETGRNEFDPNSRKELTAYAESSVKAARAGERFQFFRSGYYIADTVLSKEGEPVFNQIVGLKSSWRPE